MTSVKEQLKSLPYKSGVYLFKSKSGEVIYVGKAKSLRKRVTSYFSKTPGIKTAVLLSRLDSIDYILAGSELAALLLENELIKKYKPRYNISLRDDKSYPYLKLTVNEKWPRLFVVRKKQSDGALYFGRYQGGMVREIVRLVKKLFPIRWCKESPLRLREQPCLYYRIGACAGPCLGGIKHDDYLALVQGIAALLRGKMSQALNKLNQEMAKASQARDYEKAAAWRDSAKLLVKMIEGRELRLEPAPRVLSEISDLQKELKLDNPPMRIEAFDISNIGGTNVVGAMVTFFGGVPLKSDYRRFKIKNLAQKANDVAAIYEVVKRRYAGTLAQKMPRPNLIVVDGGLAQVNAGWRGIAEAGIGKVPIIGLAKKEEEIYFPNRIMPLRLAPGSRALQLLQRVRNEVHRLAIIYHRERRTKSLFAS
ncbi:hypothetical protein A3H38_06145 [candidate division WOR-1 bacterium RIFCSPLOWO2_02_FULL_46_20]|uniref:Excinuclease ABC subunit C n=1 Tax=candidate division WOR-1 bacterium RIFCSPLOWO2_02_FULL_46_20 TaxID=1802567 RepID=A0A1F4RDK4_UNCSA|nr:MAG: hypothetical protein A3J44_00565 [candidate division WOR-1 bacterium RIFCSPHIGHO2_02_FULL_45_12]OGC05543.1 MAG: hypothetical protein A3H38_06145 [candidate division WOR-1 bacterium RIFCSPLOWO2_02_FULL_46_20]